MTSRSPFDTIEMTEDSFGRRLRAERERRRIALEAIAANTKIGIALLRGLERDDISRWPSGIFRRSFIRSYAEAIGLDGDDTVREFLERFPEPQAAGLSIFIPRRRRPLPLERPEVGSSSHPRRPSRAIFGRPTPSGLSPAPLGSRVGRRHGAGGRAGRLHPHRHLLGIPCRSHALLLPGRHPVARQYPGRLLVRATAEVRRTDLGQQAKAYDETDDLGSDPAVLLNLDHISS